jgi:O-antigen/teichoic acid export membrane protein
MHKKRIISAGSWVLVGYFMSQLVRLGSNLVLTRLLVPEMFGVMSIVYVINICMSLCTEMGLKQNIIRHARGAEPEYFNTAWTMQIFRGFLIWLLVASVGCWLKWSGDITNEDGVYAYPQLPLILWIAGANPVISGFGSSKAWLAQRDLQLTRLTLIDMFSQVVGIAAMIAWAYYERSIWGLVYGNMLGNFLTVSCSHLLLKGQGNKFYFDPSIALEFFHFGKWLFASSLITFFALHGDRMILGKFLTAEVLSIYTVAYFLMDTVNSILGKISDGVLFPLLSSTWRDNPKALKASYYKIRLLQDSLVLLVAGFLYSVAPLVIDILYDERYKDAGWILRVLSISLIGSNYALGSRLLTIIGKPFVRTVIVAARGAILWVTVPLAFNSYGLHGAVYAIAANVSIEVIILMVALYKYKLLNFFREFMLIPVVVVGYGMGEAFKELYYLIPKEFALWYAHIG